MYFIKNLKNFTNNHLGGSEKKENIGTKQVLDNDTIKGAIKLWITDNIDAINKFGSISGWDVSNVTNMHGMFYQASDFNEDISDWDVSNVTNMSLMFDGASNFNQPIWKWEVSKVTNMQGMFNGASNFNQPIWKWKVSNVTNMSLMFYGASNFNQPLKEWDVRNVTNMQYMFYQASDFNEDISDWNVSNVTNMSLMFNGASNFNQPILKWDVSNVTNMLLMFNGASNFNQPIWKWDVSNVTNMQGMFYGASNFNQPILGWDVSNVTNMQGMFYGASNFNQPIWKWDVSNVTNMQGMFYNAVQFKQDISIWNVTNTNTKYMFKGATNMYDLYNYYNEEDISDFFSGKSCTYTPIIGDYVKVNDIQGIYVSENKVQIINVNYEIKSLYIGQGFRYKLISIHDYIKSKHIEYINLKLKMFQEDLIVQYPDDWSIADATTNDATTIDIGIDDKDKLPQFFDFIFFFLMQHGFNTGISVYNIPIFTLKFPDQIGTDYSGLFNTFLSTFVLSLTKKEPVTINYFNSSLDCLSFNKEFQLSKELSKEYTKPIKKFIEDLFLTSPNSLLDETREYHRVIYSYFTSSFLARIITLEPHHSIKNFYGSHLFIPDLKLDPYILISMKNYITNKKIIAENKYKDKDKQFSIFQDIIDYLSKNKSIDIVFDTSKETKYRSIIKNEMNILFPSDIYTIDQLYIIYEEISEGSILRKSTSFEILQLHKIETEEEWDTKWDDSHYSYKLHSALEDLDDNLSGKEGKLFKIDFKDKDIWIKFLLQYEFENLLDGSGINLAFFIHGFFSTYYTISAQYRVMIDNYMLIARGSLRRFKNIPDITELDLFLDFGKDLINSLSLDELNILFSGPQEINRKTLKEAIKIKTNRSSLTNDHIIQQIHKGIDSSDDEILKLFLQSITGFKSLLGKNITFDIHETSTWHEGLTIHTCFSNIEIESRLFRDISTLQGELDELNSKITKTEEEIEKIKTIEWSIENNIMKNIFNKDWLTRIIGVGFSMVGGAYEIINSLSNFNF